MYESLFNKLTLSILIKNVTYKQLIKKILNTNITKLVFIITENALSNFQQFTHHIHKKYFCFVLFVAYFPKSTANSIKLLGQLAGKSAINNQSDYYLQL